MSVPQATSSASAWPTDSRSVRLAVVVPPANPVVESELQFLLGGAAVLHTARLPRW